MNLTDVGGRRGMDRALLVAISSLLLLAGIAAAPAVAAEPDDAQDPGIDILSTNAGTFTFDGTSMGEPVSGGFALGDNVPISDTLPDSIRLDSTSGGAITFDAIDSCGSGGGIDLVARDLPGDFSIRVTAGGTAVSRTYARTGGSAGINLVHPNAFPCSTGDDPAPPSRIVGDTTGTLAAGNRRQCFATVDFQTVLDSRRRIAALSRVFAGGATMDRLTYVDGDPLTGAAVYHARTPRYSAIVLVQPTSGATLEGIVAEGKRKTLKRDDAITLLRRIANGESQQDVLDDLTRPARTCAWTTNTVVRRGADGIPRYFDALIPWPSGPVAVPADPSRFLDDPLATDTATLTFTIGNTSAPTDVKPIPLDQSGVFYFASADDPDAVVKVFDGCALNGHLWTFASARGPEAIDLTLTDTSSGSSLAYPGLGSIPSSSAADAFLDRSSFDCAGR